MNNRTVLVCALLLGALGSIVGGFVVSAPISEIVKRSCASTEDATKSQSNIMQATLMVESQKRMLAIQTKVVDECAKKGGIPIISGGNVDCKASFSK